MIGKAADLNKLSRTVRWSSRGRWAEEYPRHVKVVKALGLRGASRAPTTVVTVKGETRVKDDEGSIDPEMGPEEITMFRALRFTAPANQGNSLLDGNKNQLHN